MKTKMIIRSLLLVSVVFCLARDLHAQTFRAASYNIRNDNARDEAQGDGWKSRFPVIIDLVKFHEFDVLGIQEGFAHQLQDLQSGLSTYSYVGVGRDDGQKAGEHSAIFFNTEKIKLIETGDFWLSTTPELPSKGWDAALPRICTWAKLAILENDEIFYVFNVHFDHIGEQARSESAKLLLSKVNTIASTDGRIILMGDFNVDQHNESYRLLATSQTLNDAFEVANSRYATNGTFNNFNPNSKTESRIDHIFVSPGFRVNTYGVLTDTYRSALENPSEAYESANFPREVQLTDYRARLPSDHFPVVVSLTID